MPSRTSRAEQLLACTLTYRDAEVRTTPLCSEHSTAERALEEWKKVLLHEAHEAMAQPLRALPEHLYLHPVDVDTDEPGIVDKTPEQEEVVRRYDPASVPRVSYGTRTARRAAPSSPLPAAAPAVVSHATVADARAVAEKQCSSRLDRDQNQAARAEKRAAAQREAKDARARETPEERQTRLQEARQKREEAARRKAEEAERRAGGGGDEPPEGDGAKAAPSTSKKTPRALSEEAMLIFDVSAVASPKKRRRRAGDKSQYFEHPLPHHRHLQGLQASQPSDRLLPALLRGETCDDLEIFQGPPGTGKTRALVERLDDCPAPTRVFLCAPTNVGACNLYARCLAHGHRCALVLPPERVPAGTTVLTNDASERLVCGTISSRSGPLLDAQSFDAVFVDEAAQCMEAWIWTLLRPEVTRLVMAGDVHQLPALVSESGRQLRHDRSLMERLVVDRDYDNVVALTTQNRMAPEILRFPNRHFYDNALVAGPYAPTKGCVRVVQVEADGCEEAMGSSIGNRAEAARVALLLNADRERLEAEQRSVAIIAPYAAQCRLLLAQKTGHPVHTVDSFQGREADVIYLSVVRDGTHGLGFWADDRRVAVALTRARTELVVVVTSPYRWPTESALGRFVNSV